MKLQIAIIVAAYSCSVSGQGTFQNLDFEQAYPVFIEGNPYNEATDASALPYWMVTTSAIQGSGIPVNDRSSGSPWVSLIGPGSQPQIGFSPIDGNYSVLLQNFGGLPGIPSISQTGMIPDGTQSLLFEVGTYSAIRSGQLGIMVGTQAVPYTEVGTGPNYILYGVNISAWGGQSEDLTFSALPGTGEWELDDISFSPIAVTPEPSPLALTGIAGLLIALYRRFAPKRP